MNARATIITEPLAHCRTARRSDDPPGRRCTSDTPPHDNLRRPAVGTDATTCWRRAWLRMRPMRPVRALFGALLMVCHRRRWHSRLGISVGAASTASCSPASGSRRPTCGWSACPATTIACHLRRTGGGGRQYARYRLADGAVGGCVQPRPLVPGQGPRWRPVPAANVPVGLRAERRRWSSSRRPARASRVRHGRRRAASARRSPAVRVAVGDGDASVEIDPSTRARCGRRHRSGARRPLDAGVGVYPRPTAERTDDGAPGAARR